MGWPGAGQPGPFSRAGMDYLRDGQMSDRLSRESITAIVVPGPSGEER